MSLTKYTHKYHSYRIIYGISLELVSSFWQLSDLKADAWTDGLVSGGHELDPI